MPLALNASKAQSCSYTNWRATGGRIVDWSLIINETNDHSIISRFTQQSDYDNPTILPVSRSMSISMKAGCVANPGIVLIDPISG